MADHLDLSLDAMRAALKAAPEPGPAQAEPNVSRPSAVLAVVHGAADVADESLLILTRRAQHLRNHSGEVSFPGGGREAHDADLLATALRETHEEIGLEPGLVDVVAELDHLTTFSRRSYIVPYVGLVGDEPELVADPGEVERIITVPLRELLLPETYRQERWRFAGDERVMHFFDLPDDTIWGATAAMLYNLLGVLTGTYGGPDWHSRGI